MAETCSGAGQLQATVASAPLTWAILQYHMIAQFTSQTLASIDAPALLVDVHHVLQAVRAAVQRACLAAVVERRALQAAVMHAALVLDIHLPSSSRQTE